MSKDAVKQMFSKMEKDAVLKGKYVELMQAHQIEAANALTEKLVEFGKTSGFAFSKVDLNAAIGEMINKTGNSVELSDDELDKVAGGLSSISQTSLIQLYTMIANAQNALTMGTNMESKFQQGKSSIIGNLH